MNPRTPKVRKPFAVQIVSFFVNGNQYQNSNICTPCAAPHQQRKSLLSRTICAGLRSLIGLSLAVSVFPCLAQQVPTEPTSSHIFPAGGRRGTAVSVRVGGEFLPPYSRFRLLGDGVSAPPVLVERTTVQYEPSPRRKPGGSQITYPREWRSEIAIASDAPLGQTLWRVSSARGGSGGRPFLVGDAPEFIETESNSLPERAERVTLPVTINGQIAGERDFDYYRFEAAAGSVVAVDVAAARLGSPLDAVVEIQDLRGRRLPAQEIRVGSDPVLACQIAATGEYQLLVSNLNFHGGPHYVYRITVTQDPYVVFPFPPGGQSGQPLGFELSVLNGADGLVSRKESTLIPGGAPHQFLWLGTNRVANPVNLESVDRPVIVETEPNDSADAATSVTSPSVIYGRLSSGADHDWYTFPVQKDQAVTVECKAVPTGQGSLPMIALFDAQNNLLARASTVELLPRLCRLEWRAAADGQHHVRVQDLRQGTGESVYRLQIHPTRPDFTLTAAADIANVVQGGRGEVELRIERRGGLIEPIDLKIDGLPSAVRFEPVQIPANQEVAKLAFIATDDAQPCDSLLKITGTATHGTETISRELSAAHLGRDIEGVSMGSPTVDHVQLTVRHKQVFRLFCSEAYQYAHRGTIYPYQMEVERMNGFDGEILIEMGDRQIMDLDGVQIVNSVFSAGQSKLTLPLYLPETMHINVQPHSNIYAQGYVTFQDKWGQRQSMLQVSEMRCMIRPLPTVAKLRVREKALSLRPGDSKTCTFELDRTTNFEGALEIKLQDAPTGVSMTDAVIAANQSSVTATITVVPSVGFPLSRQLRFQGNGELSAGVQVVTEATLPMLVD